MRQAEGLSRFGDGYGAASPDCVISVDMDAGSGW